jgi:formate hydrogenlyase subunit 3/multisubunit Na+/H+ antiporter MnhD subunit
MALWALGLAIAHETHGHLELSSLRELGRTHPWASAGLVLAALSAAGFPLLAGFPPRMDVWGSLARISAPAALWFLVGLAGLMIGAVRQLARIFSARSEEPSVPQESLLQRGMLGAAMVALVVLGLYPRAAGFVVDRLPLIFAHLGR